MIIMMSVQYVISMGSIQLESYGYSNELISLTCVFPPILYSLTCPFIYLLSKNMHKRGIIVIGLTLLIISLQMIGGSDYPFQFQYQPELIFLGLCLMGSSAGFLSIPALPEMMESYEIVNEFQTKYDKEQAQDLISGIFISS